MLVCKGKGVPFTGLKLSEVPQTTCSARASIHYTANLALGDPGIKNTAAKKCGAACTP